MAIPKGIKGKTFDRASPILKDAIDEEARTVELAFSSEEPVERYYGKEILSHDRGSVKLDRLRNAGALLMDHDTRDQVGVIEKVWIGDDRRGRARVRFGRSVRASEIFQDVIDGIRQLVSTTYRVHELKLQDKHDSKQDTYLVTRWTPVEISMVAVPADYKQVGVGRSEDLGDSEQEPRIKMADPESGEAERQAEMPEPKETKADEVKVDVNAERESAVQSERKRCEQIQTIAKHAGAGDLARQFCDNGKSVDEFCTALAQRADDKPIAPEPTGEIGMTKKEIQDFSFMRAIRAQAFPREPRFQEDAGFERECSQAAEKVAGKTAQGIMVPYDVMRPQQRDLTVGTDSAGGYLVETDLVGWIELLRNKMMVMQMGAQSMSGLVGDTSIPKQSAAGTAYWVAESGAPTESQPTLAQLQLVPKTVGAYTDLSRKFILQSSRDAENFVRNDISAVIAIAIDLAALHGEGASNQPRGLASTSGIGSVAGGTNGLAPTWAHVVELETDVAVANAAVGSLGYLTNAKVRGKLKQTMTVTTYGDTPIWTNEGGLGSVAPGAFGGNPGGFGVINGYRAGATNQVSSTLDKGTSTGVCSAIFFGDWSQMVVATWSGLDILTDPYTGSTSGTVRVVGLQDVDVGVRQPGGFSAMLDALTA